MYILLYAFQFYLFIHIYIHEVIFFCLRIYVCTIHEHDAHGGQKRVLLDPMELDLWMLVSHCAGAGKAPLWSIRSGSALNTKPSPGPCMHFSKVHPTVDHSSCVINFPARTMLAFPVGSGIKKKSEPQRIQVEVQWHSLAGGLLGKSLS